MSRALDDLGQALGFGKFCCPKCGSNYFGTSGDKGYCKGHHELHLGYTGCDFEWTRKERDSSVGLTKPVKAPHFIVEDHKGKFVDDSGKSLFVDDKE